jgi:CheY-like chemotaxis protein
MARKILVVDDDEDVLRAFRVLLEDNGYVVETASDGLEALERLRTDRPDLVTLDMVMPGSSGVKVYRELRQREELRGIPVLVVSGVEPEFEGFISNRRQVPPPDGYLEKPVALADVLMEVERILCGPFGLDDETRRALPWSVSGVDRSRRS